MLVVGKVEETSAHGSRGLKEIRLHIKVLMGIQRDIGILNPGRRMELDFLGHQLVNAGKH